MLINHKGENVTIVEKPDSLNQVVRVLNTSNETHQYHVQPNMMPTVSLLKMHKTESNHGETEKNPN